MLWLWCTYLARIAFILDDILIGGLSFGSDTSSVIYQTLTVFQGMTIDIGVVAVSTGCVVNGFTSLG